MNSLVQFFCEFFKLTTDDIKNLSLNIKTDVFDIEISDIQSIIGKIDISQSDLDKFKSNFMKIQQENKNQNIKFITFLDKDYPQSLKNISNIPKILYYKGDINLINHERNIAVVGSRKPTPYGRLTTSSLVKELVENNFCIVSGFASGVDSISHKTAIENNGKTICVFGTPVNKIYPAKNKQLFDDVLYSGGLIVSEHHCLKNSYPQYFALRNRIISGLSSGVLITEAGSKSGTLITANYALEQGKHVFAVPGNINSNNSIGTNKLIKDGACMTTNIDDILFEYGYEASTNILSETEKYDDLSEIEKLVYLMVKSMGQCHPEKIAMKLSTNIQDIIAILNILDIKGYISYDGFIANCKFR